MLSFNLKTWFFPSFLRTPCNTVLTRYGGILMCCFKYYESQGDVDQRDVDKMTLEQFRTFWRDARILNDNFKPAQIDEIYGEAAKVQKMVSKKVGGTGQPG